MHIKNNLIIMLDTEKDEPIKIGKNQGEEPSTEEELKNMVIMDMATLCEALVVTIKAAHSMGIKDESQSMRDCMNHLQSGFVDCSTSGSLSEHAQEIISRHKK